MPNGRTHLTRLGALALASAATLGAAGVAGATTPGSSGTTGSSGSNDVPSTLAGIKAKANTDITDRVNSLNSAIEKVKAAKGLGSGQGTLEAYLGTDITPLQQLDATIQGETSAQQAAADFRTIFTNFRVYRLVLPATHIAGNAFRVTTTAVPNLQAASTKAQQYVNPGNQGVLEPLIDDLNGQISRRRATPPMAWPPPCSPTRPSSGTPTTTSWRLRISQMPRPTRPSPRAART